ncbi:DegT/DnrJ/EryC1/StrS family aminotransferase [Vibrio sp. Of7-15]|uniref:DegT/DnrJ/EryC1/StrS family aminotransferase n=1 Tax=Vibrio sp. Of7-15 TaxID=2724879 RepID=UPI001EF313C5|nr:DegT/DnrJ/EryC1/StrS family aminotransferase [Vibrio sp. Of7-15]MCG7495346.1 DegT/DnrJ/EryC1/StrS family aminotransferase [Vibrio sp. Of7-15]
MRIPFHKAHITEDEVNAVSNTIRSGWLTMGPKTAEFEENFKHYIGCQYAVSLNSATAALHLALKAVNLQQGDEVIIPTNTFIATAEVITYFNATPVLCDIEESTHNIDVKKIPKLITPKTKAIIPVHFAGQPCDMDELHELANQHDLKIIEDAAHAIPSSYKGTVIGNLKKTAITCFSFYATKTLATGEGGMAVTNNETYAAKITTNRLHGINRDVWKRDQGKAGWKYDVIDNGCKYNSTDLSSALGIVQLNKQQYLKDKRSHIAHRYTEAFKNMKGIQIVEQKEDRESSYHLYVIKIDNRDKIINILKDNGINCSVHFIPVHLHSYYKNKFNYQSENYPVSNEVYKKSLSLPIYPDMTPEEIEYVISQVKQALGR